MSGEGVSRIGFRKWLLHRVALGLLPATIGIAAVGHRWGVPAEIVWYLGPLGIAGWIWQGRSALTRLQRSPPFYRRVLAPVLLTRLLVFVVSAVAATWVGFQPAHGRFRVAENPVINLPARWDAGWYLGIARNGYSWDPAGYERQQSVAFFPAFPLTMRVAAEVLTVPARLLDAPDMLGGGNARLLWAGVAVSLGCLFVGCAHLRQLECARGTPPFVGSVTLLCAYPFAIFFSAPYTEAMFLMAAVGAFAHLEAGSGWRAACYAALAGLTRPNGFLLAVALLVWCGQRFYEHRQIRMSWLFASVAPLLSMAAYSGYVSSLTGDPLAWMKAQAAWGNTPSLTGFFESKWNHISSAGLSAFMTEPLGALSVAAVVLASIACVRLRRQWAYSCFVVVYLAPAILIDLPAVGRMTSVLFPVFLWQARWPRIPALVALGLYVLLQIWCAVVFITWGNLW